MSLPRLLLGAVCGALAVPFFQQAALGVLNGLGLVAALPYRQVPVPPWGLPQLWDATAWGAIWGAVFAWVESRRGGVPLVLAAILFGAVVPLVLGAWVAQPLLRGTALFATGNTQAMIRQAGIHATWGFGLAVFWAAIPGLFRR